MPVAFARKYSEMLALEIMRLKPSPGTIPADMKVIRQILTQKLGDKVFMERMVNEALASKRMTVTMK